MSRNELLNGIKRTLIENGFRYGCRYVTNDSVVTRPHKYEGIEEYLFFSMDGHTQKVTKGLLEYWQISVEDAFKFAERNSDSSIVMILAEKLRDRRTL